MPPKKKFNPFAILKPPTKKQKKSHADRMKNQRDKQKRQMDIKNELETQMKAERAQARAENIRRQRQLAYEAIVRKQMEVDYWKAQVAKDREKNAKKGNNNNNNNNNNNSLKQYKYIPPKYGNKKSSSSKKHPSRDLQYNTLGLEFQRVKADGHCFFHALFKCLRHIQYGNWNVYLHFKNFLLGIITEDQRKELARFKRELTQKSRLVYRNENDQVKTDVVEGIYFRYLVQFTIKTHFVAMTESIRVGQKQKPMGNLEKQAMIKQILWSRTPEERATKLGENALASDYFTLAERKDLLNGDRKQTNYNLFLTGEWIMIYDMVYPVIWLLQESFQGNKSFEFYKINSIQKFSIDGEWERYFLNKITGSSSWQRFYVKNKANDLVTGKRINSKENTYHIFMEFSGYMGEPPYQNPNAIYGGHFSPLLPLTENYTIELKQVKAKT